MNSRSDHPLARAIVHKASTTDGIVAPASEVRVIPALGVVGTVNGKASWIGSPRLAAEQAPQDRW